MIIQARMENIFNFLSSCDTFHMSALFLLKPLTFLFGLSVLFVFPQKNTKKTPQKTQQKTKNLYPGRKERSRGRAGGMYHWVRRQLPSALAMLICSHLPSPCKLAVLQNPAAFLTVPHPSPTLWITVGFSLRCCQRLEERGWSQAQEQIRA